VLVGETWTEPEPLNEMVNSDAWESHASMTADEKTIFFVSNREGGEGGRDIYRVTTLPTGDWSKPLNLGSAVNTAYEEDAVYIAPDGKTLYFSSNGHSSMGGFDIFYSSLGVDDQWSKPENIGYPLNTADDDLFFSPTADGGRAYYSSRKDGGIGLKDIYSIDLPNLEIEANFTVLKGYIYAPEGESLPADALLQVIDMESGEMLEYKPRQRDGGYVAILPPCKEYKLQYFANNAVVSSEEMKLPCNSNYNELKKEVFLQPVYVNGAEPNTGLELEADEGATESEEEIEESVEPETELEVADNEEDEEVDEVEVTVDDLSEFEVTFSRRFNYAHNSFEGTDANFRQFVNSVKEITKNDRMVIITIEGSASKVPTSDYPSNYELAMSRAQNAKKIISQKLMEAGVQENAIRFEDLKASVQGPNYNNDVNENRKVYERFQYIKVTAK
jgi:flagellar motor protein MotB